jgi:hypothetical protein
MKNILNRVHELGSASDEAVVRSSRKEDLVRNLAFAIHQQRLWGSLDRLKKQNPFSLQIPPKIEAVRLASALKATQGNKRD